MTLSNKKIFQLVTVSKSIPLMKGQIEYLRDKGLDVHVVSSEGPEQNRYSSDITHVVNMEREISLKNDLKSLINMIRLFKKEKPHIVNSGTPKAGLIGTLAAFITKRPVRIYTVRGLRLETATSFKYKILYAMEKLAMFCATDVISVSYSLRDKILELNLTKSDKIMVLGNGSSNGVDLSIYNKENNNIPKSIKKELSTNFVIGFAGRIVRDKGIYELIEAFKELQNKHLNIKLLVLGDFEKSNSISKKDYNYLVNNKDVILTGHVNSTANYFNHIDVLVLPTYREGFSNVSIEAQAVGIPVITTNATGAIDTVEDGVTGFIVEKGNINEIVKNIETLLKNQHLKEQMGENARKRVEEYYSNEVVWTFLENMYKDYIKRN